MSLIQFLKESTNHSNVVLQTLIDNLDNGHVDYSPSKIAINVGSIIKKSKFSNLTIVLKKGATTKIKLAKSKQSGGYVILVQVKYDLPERKEIDSFITDHDNIFKKLLAQIDAYIKRKDFADADDTDYEKTKQGNTAEGFEATYQKFTDSIKERVDEYKKLSGQLKQKLEITNNVAKKSTTELAIKNLKKETIGNSKDEFVSIARKLIGDELKALDSTMRQKMQKRIESYYEQVVNSI